MKLGSNVFAYYFIQQFDMEALVKTNVSYFDFKYFKLAKTP